MIAPRRPSLPIDHPEADGPIPTELAEAIAQVLLEAAEQRERVLRARATEQNANAEDPDA